MRFLTAAVCLLLLAVPGTAQDEPLFAGQKNAQRVESLKLTTDKPDARRGEAVPLKLTMLLAPGYHTYATKQTDPKAEAFVTTINVDAPNGWKVNANREPAPKAKVEEALGTVLIHDGSVTWEWLVTIPADAKPGQHNIKVSVQTSVCDDNGCLPYNGKAETTLTVSDAPPVAPSAPEAGNNEPPANGKGAAPGPPPNNQPRDFWGFLLNGIFWGALSLLTPCVFPMIPITVSFFIKQAEQTHHRPLAMAMVYSLTIVVVLTLGSVLLLTFFQFISQHWITNLLLGLLFVFFALSLFGLFEIRLPSGLATFTSTREGQGGMVGVIFMALTFTIISFTCIAPFMGGFAGTGAQQRPFWQTLVGGLAFSMTFASPFFFLALFPSLLKNLPKSGSWMNNVKVVMGFLEVAAGLKFLRSAELYASALYFQSEPHLFTFDFVLAMYVALSIACGLYLLNLYRMDHDSPLEAVGTLRLLLALAFLGLGVYLAPGLWGRAPRGSVYAWINSFLLPDAAEKDEPAAGNGGQLAVKEKLAWIPNIEEGLSAAKEKKRRIFIDFTGVT